ncbi:MAG: bifunctional DNA-formamidopyrimidine glycosylase/DNA-(apurinic or apyrimidinic site) lyase [Candidatus Dormibacteraceae bacterium]
MPELPELEALRHKLAPRLEGRMVTAVEINPAKAHLLRYPVDEFAREVPGRRIESVARRGKHMVFGLGDHRLVINPMLGGRFGVVEVEAKLPATHVFSLRLEGREELRYTDFKELGRIYWVVDPQAQVPAWAELGPEADSLPELGIDEFRRRLRRYRGAVKDLLRDQAFLAGIGNAYSDEILWEAQLLPLRRRASLKPAEEEALYTAIPKVLAAASTAILADADYDESKQNRSFMNVHAKGEKPCPRCGHRISQLGSNREPLNFCRGCQR